MILPKPFHFRDHALSSAAGNAVCTTRPRARASTTPSARSDSSVSVCTARARVVLVVPTIAAPAARSSLRAARRPAPARRAPESCARHMRRPPSRRRCGLRNSAGERLAVLDAHRLDLGIDRLGDHRPGQPAVAQRARGKCRDRGGQRRDRARRRLGRAPHGADLALGNGARSAPPTRSVLDGK